jgi:hypothetical protein
VHDDGPQIILQAPGFSPERAAERLRAAEAILAEAGFHGAAAEEHGETLVVRLPAPADITRLQDDDLRDGLVTRLSALGFPYVALDLALNAPEAGPSGGAP